MCGGPLSVAQANSYVNMYRTELMPRYPFVVIPSHIDALTLRRRSKCLFWTILSTVAPLSGKGQASFKLWFRKYIAEHIVVLQHRNIGLLQAILVHVAW